MFKVAIKRVYEQPETSDGKRILVDRLWPRGLSKEKVQLALWLKEVAPSDELRRWFGHDPEKFAEFRSRYKAELSTGVAKEKLDELRALAQKEPITLLFAARDTGHNNAVVLRDELLR